MEQLIEDLKKYLHDAVNVSVDVRSWKGQSKLPFFLIDSYNFYEISLFKKTCLLMIARENLEIASGVICKNWEQVQKKWDGLCVYVQSSISSYNRKRLIDKYIPFIVPGNQMYLPHFGIDLREHFRKLHARKQKMFSPGTQAVVIYALNRNTSEQLTPAILALKLGYTSMSMSRALDELKAEGIGEVFRKGKERIWCFSSKKALWEQAKRFLRSPVKKRIWLKKKKPKIIAGLSALAQFSMLTAPVTPVFATSIGQWEEWKQLGMEELPFAEDATVELEIWHYDPNLFSKDGVVDPFSLYLSLEENPDERIETALEEMWEKITW